MFVPIIMGSGSDLPHAEKIVKVLDTFGIESEVRVASAHKAATFLLGILEAYEADPRAKVYITIAGRSNALSGMVDGHVLAPNIACPPYSSKFGGADLYSSLRMPSGVAPATILEPASAALLAAKILSLAHPELREKVRGVHAENLEKIKVSDGELQS